MLSFTDLIWILFIIVAIFPLFSQRLKTFRRMGQMKLIELKRKSRVITLIHRQERLSILGLPFTRFIDIEDSKDVLRAIRLTPVNRPIDFIIHTPGGLVLASEQIASALVKHKGKVTIFVPHYAMSGGTLIALAGDQIVMDENAVLGPLDPQVDQFPAISLLKVPKLKPAARIQDRTFILADVAKKALKQLEDKVAELLFKNGMKQKKADNLARQLTRGNWTHDYPIEFEEAKKLGLPVAMGIPKEIYDLLDLYDEPDWNAPVQYTRDQIQALNTNSKFYF